VVLVVTWQHVEVDGAGGLKGRNAEQREDSSELQQNGSKQ
jgi:hypothetical protein